MLLICYLHACKGGEQYRDVTPFDLAACCATFWVAIPGFGMAAIVVAASMGGIVTPTEAAALAAATVRVGLFVYGDLKWRDLPGVFLRSTSFSASILQLTPRRRAQLDLRQRRRAAAADEWRGRPFPVPSVPGC